MHLPIQLTRHLSSLGLLTLITLLSLPALDRSARNAQAQDTPADLTHENALTIELTGLRNTEGQVCFSLYDNSEGFPDNADAIAQQKCIAASDATDTAVDTDTAETTTETTTETATETATEVSDTAPEATSLAGNPISVTFEGLTSGTYAVSVYHDENEDGHLNRNGFLGIPKEGFGFSRNPAIQTRAPEFHETGVFVFGRNTTTDIELIYF